jgi:hypothetical protein
MIELVNEINDMYNYSNELNLFYQLFLSKSNNVIESMVNRLIIF